MIGFILSLSEEGRIGKDFQLRETGSLESEEEYSLVGVSHIGSVEVPFPGSLRHKLRGEDVGQEG